MNVGMLPGEREGGGGGGGTPLDGLYRYVQPQKVGFSAILVIFGHFGL